MDLSDAAGGLASTSAMAPTDTATAVARDNRPVNQCEHPITTQPRAAAGVSGATGLSVCAASPVAASNSLHEHHAQHEHDAQDRGVLDQCGVNHLEPAAVVTATGPVREHGRADSAAAPERGVSCAAATPATVGALVHSAKVWFARTVGGGAELLSFYRTYGTRSFDTFGGHCDDGEGYSAAAWREVACEELFLPPSWESLLAQALSRAPTVVRIQMRRRLHSTALWLVWLDAWHCLDVPVLRPSGIQEAGDSLAWRTAADVLSRLREQSFLSPSTEWLASAVLQSRDEALCHGVHSRGGAQGTSAAVEQVQHEVEMDTAIMRSLSECGPAADDDLECAVALSIADLAPEALTEGGETEGRDRKGGTDATADDTINLDDPFEHQYSAAMFASNRLAAKRAADAAAEAAQIELTCADSRAEEAAKRAADEAAEAAQLELVLADSLVSEQQDRSNRQVTVAEPHAQEGTSYSTDVGRDDCDGCELAAQRTAVDRICHEQLGMMAKPEHMHCHSCGAAVRLDYNGYCSMCNERPHGFAKTIQGAWRAFVSRRVEQPVDLIAKLARELQYRFAGTTATVRRPAVEGCSAVSLPRG